MDGRRANIRDVLDRLEVTLRPFADKRKWETNGADILESIDLNKLEIVGPTGSLFEVDIPNNDVLLDEDKPLSEQPLKVRKAILEYYRQRPNDYIAPKPENDLGTTNGKQFYKEVVFQMYNKRDRKSHQSVPHPKRLMRWVSKALPMKVAETAGALLYSTIRRYLLSSGTINLSVVRRVSAVCRVW